MLRPHKNRTRGIRSLGGAIEKHVKTLVTGGENACAYLSRPGAVVFGGPDDTADDDDGLGGPDTADDDVLCETQSRIRLSCVRRQHSRVHHRSCQEVQSVFCEA